MCKCTQTDGYVQAMQNAKSVEKNTGVEQAVFTKNGISYFGKREDVAKQEGICCYILTSGEEFQIEAENKAIEIPAESFNAPEADEQPETTEEVADDWADAWKDPEPKKSKPKK